MDFTENTNPKIRTILIVLTIGWFLLLQWWTTDQSDLVLFILIFGFCLLWIFWSLLKTDTERKKKEDERRENWEKTWKGEPEIFKLLEENKTPDDFRTLISTISEFLDYCWFHPFIADLYLHEHKNERDLKLSIDSLDGTISSIRDLNSSVRFDGHHFSTTLTLYSYEYSLDILYTIAKFCGIQKENGLGFYVKKLNDEGKKFASIEDVPEQVNFVSLGDPNVEILDQSEKIGSAFNQDYEIRDISTFDSVKHKQLEHDLAKTLRCCICDILNTRLTEDIVVTLQGYDDGTSYENDKIKRKFLDAMIIEIWAICGGLAIEMKTYSDLRFNLSIDSMQKEKDRPKSAFRTKKSSDET